MAILHPESLSHLPDEFSAEKTVFEKLKALSNEFHVFHSITWNEGHKDGECDFVILHKLNGFLTLEVKGGMIEFSGSQWTSTNRNREIIPINDPVKQAKSSMYAFRDYWRKKHGQDVPCNYGWAVCFLDGAWDNAYATTELKETHVIDSRALENIAPWIDEYFNRLTASFGRRVLSDKQAESFISMFNRDLKVNLSLAKVINEQEAELRQVNVLQDYMLDLFDGKNKIGFRGAAGTGKTWLAMKKARRLAGSGKRVLFLCYNSGLAHFISDRLSDEDKISVSTYHSFAIDIVKNYLASEIEKSGKEKEFWAMTSGIFELGLKKEDKKEGETARDKEKKEKGLVQKLQGVLFLFGELEYGKGYSQAIGKFRGVIPDSILDVITILCPEKIETGQGEGRYLFSEGIPLAIMQIQDTVDKPDTIYDALIIDEGQDFDENWCSSLEKIFPDFRDRIVYIFYDDNQSIFIRKKELPVKRLLNPSGSVTYQLFDLHDNLRNTRNIHDHAKSMTGLGSTARSLDIMGIDPEEKKFNDHGKAREFVGLKINELVAIHNIPNEKIAVISNRSIENSIFTDKTAGDYTLTHTGKGNKGKNIKYRTIQQFKGLESDVVILVIHEREEDREEERHLLNEVMYVGYTRAKHLLFVVRVG